MPSRVHRPCPAPWSWQTSLLLAALASACGAESRFDPDTNVAPPLIRDAGAPDAPPSVGDAGPTCTPPSHMILRSMPEGANIAPGWTGLTHNVGFPDNTVYAVETFDCNVEEGCSFCKFRGPVEHPMLPFDSRRCVANPSLKCDSNEDCGGSPCRFFYGPGVDVVVNYGFIQPQVCLTMYFEELAPDPMNPGAPLDPVQGSIDFSTGEVRLDSLNIKSDQRLFQCNYCVGDDVDSDGKRDGTCASAETIGGAPKPCDTQGRDAKNNAYSLDCRAFGDPIGSFTLQNGPMSTSSEKLELTNESPSCGREPGAKCWCGVCSGGNPAGQVCTSTADCEDRGNGTCVAAGNSRTDACVSSTDFLWTRASCNVADPKSNTGTCTALVPSSELGEGVGGAKVVGAACFRGNGAVGERLEVKGELATFSEEGRATPKLVSAVCVPGSGNAIIDDSTGLPGPGIFEVRLDVTLVGGGSGAVE